MERRSTREGDDDDDNNNNNDDVHEHEEGCITDEGCDVLHDFKFDEEWAERLFKQLDVNRDGKIDFDELAEGLKQFDGSAQAERIMEKGDITRDSHFSFDEFMKFCKDHDMKLWITFKDLDISESGALTPDDIRSAFKKKLDLDIPEDELDKLMKKFDKDNNLEINWEEWREHHHPFRDDDVSARGILRNWSLKWHHVHIDTGGDVNLPEDLYEEEKKGWRVAVAGAVAGVVSRTCTAPLDRLKIMLQVHAGSQKNNWTIKRLWDKMISEGGKKSLWRGNFTNCMKIAPETAIKFWVYEKTKGYLNGESGDAEMGMGTRFVAGAFAGVVTQFSIYPFEVLKTRLALGRTGEYRNFLDCGMKIYQQDGKKVFFRGLVPGLIGIIPYAGVDLCIYETLKLKYLSQYPKGTDPPALLLLGCGALSSSCGQLVSYPLALIRTKLQAQTTDPTFKGIRADGMRDMGRQIIQQNGLRGLYRGIIPNFMKVLPSVSISYMVYEKTKKKLGMYT